MQLFFFYILHPFFKLLVSHRFLLLHYSFFSAYSNQQKNKNNQKPFMLFFQLVDSMRLFAFICRPSLSAIPVPPQRRDNNTDPTWKSSYTKHPHAWIWISLSVDLWKATVVFSTGPLLFLNPLVPFFELNHTTSYFMKS